MSRAGAERPAGGSGLALAAPVVKARVVRGGTVTVEVGSHFVGFRSDFFCACLDFYASVSVTDSEQRLTNTVSWLIFPLQLSVSTFMWAFRDQRYHTILCAN